MHAFPLKKEEIVKVREDVDAHFLQYILSFRITVENTHGAVASPKGRQL